MKHQVVIIFLRLEENMGGKKKINGDADQVDRDHNRRASIFLLINPLKINTSRFDSIVKRGGQDRSIPGLVTHFSRSSFMLNKGVTYKFQHNNLGKVMIPL